MYAIRQGRPFRRALLTAALLLVCLVASALTGAAAANAGRASALTGSASEPIALLSMQAQLAAFYGGNYAAANDCFGTSVAVSGDTAVVGANYAAVGLNKDQGRAYVFTRSGTTWILQQTLTAADGAAGDCFGTSVAIAGDTALVSAVNSDEDSAGDYVDKGSTYVFTRNGTVWSQQQKLTAADGAAGDLFGGSVAISGDTALVGADGAHVGLNRNQGAAYVFTGDGTVWSQQQKLTVAEGTYKEYLGSSVAISGDTALVGAPTGGYVGDQGAAYVFTRDGTVWNQKQKLTVAGGTYDDWFGCSVAISGDTVVVGAGNAKVGGKAGQGSAYVFTRNGTVWSQQLKLTAADGGWYDQFGCSAAISSNTVVVGAYYANLGAAFDDVGHQGAAYVFVRIGTVWSQQRKLTAPLPPKPGRSATRSPKGLVSSRTPTFRWTAAARAASYELRVYRGRHLVKNVILVHCL